MKNQSNDLSLIRSATVHHLIEREEIFTLEWTMAHFQLCRPTVAWFLSFWLKLLNPIPKRYEVKECASRCVYRVNLEFKDCNSINASLYTYLLSMYSIMYIGWGVYFVTGLSYVLQQPLTAELAKTKANIVKKSSHSYSSHCPDSSVLFWKRLQEKVRRKSSLKKPRISKSTRGVLLFQRT